MHAMFWLPSTSMMILTMNEQMTQAQAIPSIKGYEDKIEDPHHAVLSQTYSSTLPTYSCGTISTCRHL